MWECHKTKLYSHTPGVVSSACNVRHNEKYTILEVFKCKVRRPAHGLGNTELWR